MRTSIDRYVVVDAFGTLLDLSSPALRVLPNRREALRLSAAWRAFQLEIAWTEMTLGVPLDFWSVTERALHLAVTEACGEPPARELSNQLLRAYRRADPFRDAASSLRALREMQHKPHVFSNANPDMLTEALEASGLIDLVDGQTSVECVGYYKPHEATYRFISEHLDSCFAVFCHAIQLHRRTA